MAVDITTIGIEYDTSGLEKGTRAQNITNVSAIKLGDSISNVTNNIHNYGNAVEKTEKSVSSFNKILGIAATALAAVGGVMLAKKFVETADAVSLMDARLKLATGTLKEFGQAQKDIYSIAQANNVGLMETAQLYTKLSDPVKRLGGTTREVNAIVSSFATSMRVGGASAQEASSATLQFAQAMGSGKLQGDEFRSLAEASPRFMKALAEGMNLPIEKLKQMGTDGKLTADVVGNDLIKSLDKLKKEAESLPDTVSGAITRFKNDIIVAVGEINKAEGFTTGFAGLIESARGLIPIIRDELKSAFEAVNAWVNQNKTELSEVWDNAKGLVGQVWELAKSAASVAGFLGEWLLSSGTVKTDFEYIRFLVAGFQDGVTIIGAGFATMGSKIFQFVLTPLQKVLEMSAKIAGVFDDELAAKIRGVGTEIDTSAKAGEQYGDSVVAAFARGDTAVGRLNKSLETTGKETKTAAKETKAAEEAYAKLHSNVAKEAKGATTAQLAASASRKLAHKAEIDLLKELTKDFKEFDKTIAEHTKKVVADIIGGIKDQDKNYLSTKKSMDEYAAGMSQANELAELEIQLLGASAVERNTIIEQKKIEFKLEKQLAEIRESNMAGWQKSDLIDQANAQAMLDKASAGLRSQQQEYTKFFGEIYNGLSDSLYRGFEAGKGFGRSFMDSLKNLFKTNVIKIAVQAVMGTGSSIVSSIAGAAGSSGTSAGSLLSMGKTLWDGFSLAGTVGGGLGQLGGYLGSTTLSAFASGMSGTAAGTFAGMGPTLAGSSTGLGALAGTGGTTGVLSTGAGTGVTAAGAGSSAAAALPIVGWIAAGMMANNSLFDKGWGAEPDKNTKLAGVASGLAANLFTSTIQKWFGLSDKTASMLTGSAVVNRLFGHKSPELQQSELSGSFGANGYSASTRDVYKQQGGLFRGDKWSETVTKADSSAMTEAFTAVKDAAKGYASVLGLSTDALDTFTKDFKINLSITGDAAKDAEANQKIMTDLLSGITNDLSNLLAPSLAGFAKEGETASATLQRLATGLASVNEIMTAVGFDKFAQSLEGANASQRLLDLTGGIEKLASGAQYFFENFLTDAEKIKPSVDLVSSTMAKLGQSSVDTVDEFKMLVQGLDKSTQAGAEMYASLIAIAPQFKAVADFANEGTEALKKAEAEKQIILENSARDSERNAVLSARRASELAQETIRKASDEAFKTLSESVTGGVQNMLRAGNVGAALAAKMSVTSLNPAQYTDGGGFNAGGFNRTYTIAKASAAKGMMTSVSADALNVQDVSSVMQDLIATVFDDAIVASSKSNLIDQLKLPANDLIKTGMNGLLDAGIQSYMNENSIGRGAGIANVIGAQMDFLFTSFEGSGRDVVEYTKLIDGLSWSLNNGKINQSEYAAALEAANVILGSSIDLIGNEAAQRERIADSQKALNDAGLGSVSFYFNQISKSVEALNEAASLANTPLAQVTASIGRLTSLSDVFSQSAKAALSGGGNLGNTPVINAQIVAEAAARAAAVVTTSDAAQAAKILASKSSFAGVEGARLRDVSMILDGLKQFDAASFEASFMRMNDALNRGAITQEQYQDIFAQSLSAFSDGKLETTVNQVADGMAKLRDTMRSFADGLLIDKSKTTLTAAASKDELFRQYEASKPLAAMGDPTGIAQFQSLANQVLDKNKYATRAEYNTAFGKVYGDARTLESIGQKSGESAQIKELKALNDNLSKRLSDLEDTFIATQADVIKQTKRTADLIEARL